MLGDRPVGTRADPEQEVAVLGHDVTEQLDQLGVGDEVLARLVSVDSEGAPQGADQLPLCPDAAADPSMCSAVRTSQCLGIGAEPPGPAPALLGQRSPQELPDPLGGPGHGVGHHVARDPWLRPSVVDHGLVDHVVVVRQQPWQLGIPRPADVVPHDGGLVTVDQFAPVRGDVADVSAVLGNGERGVGGPGKHRRRKASRNPPE